MNFKVQIVGNNINKARTFILNQDTDHGKKVTDFTLDGINAGKDEIVIVTETNEKRRGTWIEPASIEGLLKFAKIAKQIAA